MKYIKRSIVQMSVLLSMLFVLSFQAQAEQGPEELVRQTVDSMVAKLQTNRDLYRADNQALFDMIEETLFPALHIPRMADLVLGKQVSRSATDAQKNEFIEEFKTYLLKTYATGLLEATGKEKVIYEPFELKPGADKVKIRAKLLAASGETFPIILSMSNRNDTRWRAYNVEVIGINFIRTHRSIFALTLKNKGIDGLIADLRSKNAPN